MSSIKITKRILAVFLFVITTICSYAQTEFSGIVIDNKGVAVNRVTCRLFSASDSLISYAFTNKKGAYILRNIESGSYIIFSKVGYTSMRLAVIDKQTTYNVKLERGEISLKEVIVTAPPITQRNDTLLYNVASFQQKGDLYIEDVLKRMPGIEIDANGGITYQGVAINQVNIEGQNLMGDQYNLATQNMPAEAVSQVQVMQNDQPIRSLAGKVNTNRATLNLKLKRDYRLRPFGEIIGGYGTSGTYDDHITAIEAGKKNQFLLSAGMNNQGNNYAQVVNGVSTVNSLYTNEPLPNLFLQNANNHKSPLSPEYYLRNESYYASMHYLHALSKYSTLRINGLWFHDATNLNDSTYDRYIANDTTTIFEASASHRQTNVIKGQMQYELNSEKIYLQDEVSGKLNAWHTDECINSQQGHVDERMRRRPLTLQNIFNMNINTGARLVQLSSIFRYFHAKEELYALPDTIDDSTRLKQFFMRNRIGTSFNVFGNPLLIGYIIEYKHNDVKQSNYDDAQYGEGKSISRYWLHTLEPVYEWNFRGGSMEFRLPVEWIHYRNAWKNQSDSRWMFSPSVKFDKKLNSVFSLSANAGINQDANTIDVPVRNAITNNYRTFTDGIDSLNINKTDMVSGRLSYLSTIHLWSWDVYAVWTKTKSDYYRAYLYMPELTYSMAVWKQNKQYNWSLAYSIKKNFRSTHLTISHSMCYAYNKFLLSQNGIEDYVHSNVLNMSLSVYWDKLSWLHYKLSSAGNISWKGKDAFSQSDNALHNFYSTMHADVFPFPQLRLYADCSIESFEISHGNYSSNCFSNVGCEWNITKRFSLSVIARNIFNRKLYEETVFSGANYQYYSIPLCPRRFVVECRFRF